MYIYDDGSVKEIHYKINRIAFIVYLECKKLYLQQLAVDKSWVKTKNTTG